MTTARNIYPIRPKGIVRDVEAFELPPEFYSGGDNVVFRDELAERILGYQAILGNAIESPITHLRPVLADAVAYWLYGTANKIGVTSGTTHSDITPTTAPANTKPENWTSDTLNGIPVFNWQNAPPVSWGGSPATVCAKLPGWPDEAKCQSLRAFKNYLIAMAYDDGTTFDPNLLVWSDSAAAGALPQSWTPAAGNDAGSVSLADTPGIIIDGASFRDQFIVFKRGSTYSLDFIGGNFIFALRRLFVTTGILATNCAVEIRGQQIVFTDGDIIAHDGHSAQSIIDRQWRRFIFDNIDSETFPSSYVALYQPKGEIWFCYPTKGNATPDVALVWNYEENRFGFRELNQAGLATHAAPGIVPASAAPATDWDSQTSSWDNYVGTWNQTNFNPAQDELVQANADGTFYAMDLGASANGVDINSVLQRHSLDFGSPERIKQVTAIWPRLKGQNGGTLNVRIGSQQTQYEPIKWAEWQSFVPGQDVRIPMYARGRLISVELASIGGANWRCGGFDFEYKVRGRF